MDDEYSCKGRERGERERERKRERERERKRKEERERGERERDVYVTCLGSQYVFIRRFLYSTQVHRLPKKDQSYINDNN